MLVDTVKEALESLGFRVVLEGARKSFTASYSGGGLYAVVRQPSVSNRVDGIPLSVVERSATVQVELVRARRPTRSGQDLAACMRDLEDAFKKVKALVGRLSDGAWYLVGVARSDYDSRGRYGSCRMRVSLEFKAYEPIP